MKVFDGVFLLINKIHYIQLLVMIISNLKDVNTGKPFPQFYEKGFLYHTTDLLQRDLVLLEYH